MSEKRIKFQLNRVESVLREQNKMVPVYYGVPILNRNHFIPLP